MTDRVHATLRGYVLYGALLFVFACVAVWLGMDLADGRRRTIEQRTDTALQRSQYLSQWFGTNMLLADQLLREILSHVPSAELVAAAADPKRADQVSAWLAERKATVPNLRNLDMFGKDCVFVAATNPRIRGLKSKQNACAESVSGIEDKLYIQYVPAEKSPIKKPNLVASRYHLSPEGRLLGGCVAVIELDFVEGWITAFPLSKNDVLALLDKDGTVLAHNPPMPGIIGKKMPWPGSIPEFLDDARSSETFIVDSPLDGRKRYFGISKIENVPLLVLVGFDAADTLGEWHRRAWQIGVGYVVLLVLSVLALRTHLIALRQADEMRQMAMTDPLTGVANRRELVRSGAYEVNRVLRYGTQLSALMLDIDHFKVINDTCGHATGDRVIKAAATTMKGLVRTGDVVGRIGGEEFVVLLPETDQQGALQLAERIRAEVQEMMINVAADDERVVSFTVSIGVATFGSTDHSFGDLLDRADKGLYLAKDSGRNRVVAN